MRHFLSSLLVALSLAATLRATPCIPPAGHPDAILLGTFVSTLPLPSGIPGRQFDHPDSPAGCNVFWSTCVWRTGSGQIIYVIDPTSIIVTGNCADDVSTLDLFELLMRVILLRGAELGNSAGPAS